MNGDYPGDYEAAVAFLDRRIGYGIRPGLERIEHLLGLMGDPHLSYPVIHVAGTNGKTTVVRMISDILGAHGLFTGSFVSPHLHRIEDRYAVGGTPFGPTHLARAVEDIAPFVMMQEEQLNEAATYFELTAALGLGAFAVDAVDVAIVEVGLGGRYDATNVVKADVSVITGIALDHMTYLGDTQAKIAAEKAAILKEGGTLVTGPLGSEATDAVATRVAETGAFWHREPEDFHAVADRDERGWRVTVDGVHGRYDDLVLGIHGRHQTTNLATAIAACEAFFGRALDGDAVREAAATVRSPGRLEVGGLNPTVLIDGAHNEEGFLGLAETIEAEFEEEEWILVLGARGDRDVASLVAPLQGKVTRVFATQADDHLAVDATVVAAQAGDELGAPAEVVASVAEAVEWATTAAPSGVGVVVAGSLYVIGEARHALGLDNSASPVHRRFEAQIGE
ncbi:MAG: Mur ligase family protein [Actinomycetota bacterium]|nr:Mur ligase family protein [Actinomycetota bacterium]